MLPMKPFNANSYLKVETDTLKKSLVLENAIQGQFATALNIDYRFTGNGQQFKFIYELASNHFQTRPKLLDSFERVFTSKDSLLISRYSLLLCRSVKNGILKMERDINNKLLTPSARYKGSLNLGNSGMLETNLDLSIGSDITQPYSAVQMDFFGARTASNRGGYFISDNLSPVMKQWIGYLMEVMSQYGFSYLTLNDAEDYTGSWYLEELLQVHTIRKHNSKFELDLGRLKPLFDYMNQVRNMSNRLGERDLDEIFSVCEFARLHSMALVPSSIPSSNGKRHYKFKELRKVRSHHARELLKSLQLNFGSSFDTYEDMLCDLEYHKFISTVFFTSKKLFGLDRTYKEQAKLSFDQVLVEGLKVIPKSVSVADRKIEDYIHSIVNKIPKFYVENKQLQEMSTREEQLGSCLEVVVGMLSEELEGRAISRVQEHTERLYEEEVPYSYIRNTKGLYENLREHFVINSILSSLGVLAHDLGVQSFIN